MAVEQKKAVYAGMWFIVIMILVAMACNLNKKDDVNQSANIGDPPSIVIVNPPQTGVAGELLTIQVEATDPSGEGVTQVQLMVDNIVVNSIPSEDRSGTATLNANLTWTPPTGSQGTVTIRAIASRGLVTGRSEDLRVEILPAGSQITQTPGTGGSTGGTSPTSSPGFCRARVDTQGLRFRSQPDTSNDAYIISSFNLNDEPPIVGRLGDNSWYQVSRGSQQGWVFAGLVTVLDCGNTNIPVRSAPATWTPVPSPTLAPSAAPRPPDLIALVAGEVSLKLNSSGTATASYVITVRNIGGSASGEFDVEIILPDGGSISKTIANLEPNAQVQVSSDDSGFQSVTFTQPGTQRLRVFVDFDGAVSEIDENNNNAALDIIVEAADDPDQSP